MYTKLGLQLSFSNRSRFEIMTDIMQKSFLGAKKIWLINGANVSCSQHQRYLKTLFDLKLISKKDGFYITTEKGIVFIKSYHTLINLLRELLILPYYVKRARKEKG